jgi:hypothetical protein
MEALPIFNGAWPFPDDEHITKLFDSAIQKYVIGDLDGEESELKTMIKAWNLIVQDKRTITVIRPPRSGYWVFRQNLEFHTNEKNLKLIGQSWFALNEEDRKLCEDWVPIMKHRHANLSQYLANNSYVSSMDPSIREKITELRNSYSNSDSDRNFRLWRLHRRLNQCISYSQVRINLMDRLARLHQQLTTKDPFRVDLFALYCTASIRSLAELIEIYADDPLFNCGWIIIAPPNNLDSSWLACSLPQF